MDEDQLPLPGVPCPDPPSGADRAAGLPAGSGGARVRPGCLPARVMPPLGEVMVDGILVRDSPDGPPRAVAPGYGLPEDPAEHLAQLRDVEALARFAEIRRIALVADLVEAAPAVEREERVPCGGDGTPCVPEFLPLEIGAVLGLSTVAARLLVADVLDLKWRHPLLWNRMIAGGLPPWRALIIARMCHGLGLEAALQVDAATGDRIPGLAWSRAKRLVEGHIAAADPAGAAERERSRLNRRMVGVALREGVTGAMDLYGVLDTADAKALDETLGRIAGDLARDGDDADLDTRRARALGLLARGEEPTGPATPDSTAAPDSSTTTPVLSRGCGPVARLYVHVWADSTVARVEGHGPLPVEQLPGFLAGCRVRVTQVIDQRESVPVDAYEVPQRLREQLTLAQPYEVAPYGAVSARRADLDHTVPYGQGGSTRIENLGPLGRASHRARTHGGYHLSQPTPGRWVWRTPRGLTFEVTNHGTRHVPD